MRKKERQNNITQKFGYNVSAKLMACAKKIELLLTVIGSITKPTYKNFSVIVRAKGATVSSAE